MKLHAEDGSCVQIIYASSPRMHIFSSTAGDSALLYLDLLRCAMMVTPVNGYDDGC